MTFKNVKGTRHNEQVAEKVKDNGVEGSRHKDQTQSSVFACIISLLFLLVIYLADYEESLSEEKDRKSYR